MGILPNNLAATPPDMESLMDWCEKHTGSEKQVAIVAAMMSWNLACKVISDDQANVDAGNAAIEEIFMETRDDSSTL